MCRSIRSSFVTVFTLASLLVAAPALAVDILVTTAFDSLDEGGACSLREAVIAANTDTAVDTCAAGSGADRVLVSRGGFYPLTITGAGENASMTGDLDVVGDLQIVAVGPSSGRARIWQEDEDRALHVVRLESGTSRLKLVNISLTDAYLSAEVPYSRCGIETDGGCVYVDPVSEIEMVNSRVNSGRATERGGNVFIGEGAKALFIDTHVLLGVAEADGSRVGQGGGIFIDSEAQVEMYSVQVEFNTAGLGGWGEGGGIYQTGDSQLYAERTHIQGNQSGIDTRGIGGGLYVASGGFAELERVEVLENHATRHGGGVYLEEEAQLKSNYLNVLGNIVEGDTVNYGGGIYNLGDVHVARSDISGNQAGVENSNGRGAGVYNLGLFVADESLIFNNWASSHGGGVVSGGVTNLITSTLSGNVAFEGNGGGYWSLHQTPEHEDACDLDAGDVFIQVTVAENEAGGRGPGLHFQAGADACLINSVVADGCNFVGSTAVAYGVGQNAEPVSGSCGLGGLTLTDIQMDLGPLAHNRGTTWTHLPGSGSLLIDQADNAFCPPLDQRWTFRPTHFMGVPGDVCDLGAVEADGRWIWIEAATGSTCGLGFEFAFVLPVLTWWQRRRMRA